MLFFFVFVAWPLICLLLIPVTFASQIDPLIGLSSFILGISIFTLLLPHINTWLLERILAKPVYSIDLNPTSIPGLLSEPLKNGTRSHSIVIIQDRLVKPFVILTTWLSDPTIICHQLDELGPVPEQSRIKLVLTHFFFLSSAYLKLRIEQDWNDNKLRVFGFFFRSCFLAFIYFFPPHPFPAFEKSKSNVFA